jgi:pimeloyl-ACP methyl ester carboxylesterase
MIAISVGHPSGFARPDIDQLRKSWYMFFFLAEGASEEALTANGWRLFRKWGESAPHLEDVIARLSEPGALTAALNYYRANIDPRSWGSDPMPLPKVAASVLGIHGTEDAYLDEAQMLRSEEFVSGQWRFERVEGAGHWVPLDEPERTNDLLGGFLEDR